MPSRVSPTEKIRAEIDALFGSGRDLAEVLEDVARLGARLIMQSAVEAEVDELVGVDPGGSERVGLAEHTTADALRPVDRPRTGSAAQKGQRQDEWGSFVHARHLPSPTDMQLYASEATLSTRQGSPGGDCPPTERIPSRAQARLPHRNCVTLYSTL